MKKFFVYIFALIICVVIIFFITDAIMVGIIAGIISSILFLFLDSIGGNTKSFKYWWASLRYRNTYIRLSISYLFRIKCNDNYLLVRGGRNTWQFQPVGGVYKRLPSSNSFFKKAEILDDDLIPIDKTSKDDLRIRVKGKHLLSFLKWYDSSIERETSPWREFFEELVEPGYLDSKVFPCIFYEHLRRYEHPLRFSDWSQSPEILIAEIYELVASPEQEALLIQMYETENENYLWADEERIRRRGAMPRKGNEIVISPTAIWMFK